jgi:pseudouridine kinase
MEILHCVDTDYINAHRDIIQQSSLVVLDTNLDTEILYYIIKLCRHKQIPVLVEPVSVKKAEKMRDIPGCIDYVTPNLSELEVLSGTYISRSEQLDQVCAPFEGRYQHLLITLGGQGVFHCQAGNTGKLYPPLATRIVDVNGAGDAFVAGFVCGVVHHYDIEQCIRLGIAAANITLQSEDTVSKKLSFTTCMSLIEEEENS